ncbi:MAG: chorismate mutase [Anaerolineae bacterium]|nr:MAG: chorismate mutase [Anaerolineae bacterium]
MSIRGIRGAITAPENSTSAILQATRNLLTAIQQANPSLEPEDITSIFFTMTTDLDATYPALAARQMGWVQVPLLCAQEIPVPDSMPRCIRVLVHWNTELPQRDIQHVYLGEAARLRPDLAAVPLNA